MASNDSRMDKPDSNGRSKRKLVDVDEEFESDLARASNGPSARGSAYNNFFNSAPNSLIPSAEMLNHSYSRAYPASAQSISSHRRDIQAPQRMASQFPPSIYGNVNTGGSQFPPQMMNGGPYNVPQNINGVTSSQMNGGHSLYNTPQNFHSVANPQAMNSDASARQSTGLTEGLRKASLMWVDLRGRSAFHIVRDVFRKDILSTEEWDDLVKLSPKFKENLKKNQIQKNKDELYAELTGENFFEMAGTIVNKYLNDQQVKDHVNQCPRIQKIMTDECKEYVKRKVQTTLDEENGSTKALEEEIERLQRVLDDERKSRKSLEEEVERLEQALDDERTSRKALEEEVERLRKTS